MKGKKLMAALTAAALAGAAAGCAKENGEQSSEQTGVTGELTVYCFSAGKADAHLIYGEDWAVLIDCGEQGFGKEITAYMKENGIPALDYLMITHFDKDHVGGAAKVLKSVEVKNVLQSNCPKDSDEYENYVSQLSAQGISPQTLRESLSFTLGDAEFTVDPPAQETYENDPSNNSSLMTSVSFGSADLLFAGDAENERMAEFTAANTTDYDFLKVPYHGSYKKALGDFLESVRAEYAVITSSDKEPEDQRTLELLEGSEVFLTRTAPVKLVTDGTALTVEYAPAD